MLQDGLFAQLIKQFQSEAEEQEETETETATEAEQFSNEAEASKSSTGSISLTSQESVAEMQTSQLPQFSIKKTRERTGSDSLNIGHSFKEDCKPVMTMPSPDQGNLMTEEGAASGACTGSSIIIIVKQY